MTDNITNRMHVLHHWSTGVTEENTPNQPTDLLYGEIALNIKEGYESLMIKNNKDNIVVAKIAPYDKELDEESNNAVENQAIAKLYNEMKKQLDGIAQNFNVCGFARINGEKSTNATIFFGDKKGEKKNLKQITSHLCMGLVQDGKLYKRCANGRIDIAVDGTELSIDGSDGDVMIYTDCDLYFLKATVNANEVGVTNVDNTKEINVIALGTSPFTIYGINAKKFTPFAFTPQYTINAELDTDERECAHSIFNRKFKGNYPSPSSDKVENFVKETYSDGYGYIQCGISSVGSIWNAQGKNKDQTTNFPYMGGYYEFYEIIMSMIFMELGDINEHGLNDFGVACTQINLASTFDSYGNNVSGMCGNSGFMIFKPKEKYMTNDEDEEEEGYKIEPVTGGGLMTSNIVVRLSELPESAGTQNWYKNASGNTVSAVTGQGTYYALAPLSQYYGFAEMLEPERILNGIAKAGLSNKVWKGAGDDDNRNILFEFDGDDGTNGLGNGNVIVSNATIDNVYSLKANKKYFQVRNVPGIEGMSDGSMTAVINEYIRFTLKDGVGVKDSIDMVAGLYRGGVKDNPETTPEESNQKYLPYSEEYDGGTILYKFSYPVYKGFTWNGGPFRHLCGMHYVTENSGHSGDTEVVNVYSMDYYYHDNVDDMKPITTSAASVYTVDAGENNIPPLVEGMNVIKDIYRNNYWVGESNYNASLFCHTKSGGNSTQGEACYLWGSFGATIGKKMAVASVAGCYANSGSASLRTLDANGSAGYAGSFYAGAFALPHLKL